VKRRTNLPAALVLGALVSLVLVTISVPGSAVTGRASLPFEHQDDLGDPAAENDDDFGLTVAVDGDTLVVGEPGFDGLGDDRGAVRVYSRLPNGTWAHEQRLRTPLAPGGHDDKEVGSRVDIDADVIVVEEIGQSHAFHRDAGTGAWAHQQVIAGVAPAVSGDTIVTSSGGNIRTYKWNQSTETWDHHQWLVAGDVVAIDGDAMVVGGGGNAYACSRDPGTGVWACSQELTPPGTRDSGGHYGYAVAIAGDTIVVGDDLHDGTEASAVNTGIAHVFTRSGGTWGHTQALDNPDQGDWDRFGGAIGLDGSLLAIGNSNDDIELGWQPRLVELYTKDAGTGLWSHRQTITDPDNTDWGRFGWAVAVDAGTIALGSPTKYEGGSPPGQVHVFGLTCEGRTATLVGSTGDDVLVGTTGDDIILGLEGNDAIRGGAGNDRICGGAGGDRIAGGTGEDTVYGGNGNDVLNGGSNSDTILGGNGNDRILGRGGRDVIKGGGGNDLVYAGTLSDRVFGGPGDDRLYGEEGHDRLAGEEDNDRLFGGSGNDRLTGGAGADAANGQDGTDTCVAETVLRCEA